MESKKKFPIVSVVIMAVILLLACISSAHAEIIIAAQLLNTTAFTSGNVSIVLMPNGLYNISSTSTPTLAYNETHKLLWYGADGSNPAILNAGNRNITHIYSLYPQDVGTKAYQLRANYTNGGTTDGNIYAMANFSAPTNLTAWSFARVQSNSACDQGAIAVSCQQSNYIGGCGYDINNMMQDFWQNACNGASWTSIANYDNTTKSKSFPNASSVGYTVASGNLNGYPAFNSVIFFLVPSTINVTNKTTITVGTNNAYAYTDFFAILNISRIEMYSTNFTISANDINGTPLQTFSALITNATAQLNYTTTNGLIITSIGLGAQNYTISVSAPLYVSAYFVNYTTSANLVANLTTLVSTYGSIPVNQCPNRDTPTVLLIGFVTVLLVFGGFYLSFKKREPFIIFMCGLGLIFLALMYGACLTVLAYIFIVAGATLIIRAGMMPAK